MVRRKAKNLNQSIRFRVGLELGLSSFMKKMNKVLSRVGSCSLLALIGLSLGACGNARLEFKDGSTLLSKGLGSQNVCGSFGEPGGDAEHGLKGELFLGPPNFFSSVNQVVTHGTNAGVSLFMSQLNVTPRIFSLGFQTSPGTPVRDSHGNILTQNYGLRFESEITLLPDEPEGDYELALLADDGSTLSIQDLSSSGELLVNDDGVHPQKLACGSRTVHMTRGASHPIEVLYFQSSRPQIALMLLWRLHRESSEPYCGVGGEDFYFQASSDPSLPKETFVALQSRGWKVLAPGNYLMPRQEVNPCGVL